MYILLPLTLYLSNWTVESLCFHIERGSIFKYYLNGVRIANQTGNVLIASVTRHNELYWKESNSAAAQSITGKVDEFKIFNKSIERGRSEPLMIRNDIRAQMNLSFSVSGTRLG